MNYVFIILNSFFGFAEYMYESLTIEAINLAAPKPPILGALKIQVPPKVRGLVRHSYSYWATGNIFFLI